MFGPGSMQEWANASEGPKWLKMFFSGGGLKLIKSGWYGKRHICKVQISHTLAGFVLLLKI